MRQKLSDGMAKVQTVIRLLLGSSQFWVCTVCLDLAVPKLSHFTVLLFGNLNKFIVPAKKFKTFKKFADIAIIILFLMTSLSYVYTGCSDRSIPRHTVLPCRLAAALIKLQVWVAGFPRFSRYVK